MRVLQTGASRALRRAWNCDPLPDGVPIRASQREPVQPALFVPEQLSRVTRCAFRTTVEDELEKLTATEAMSGPPVAIEFSEAAVFGGQIFSGGRRYQISLSPPYRAALGPVRDLGEVVLAQSRAGSTVFGHWLMDDCAARELPEAQGHTVAITRPPWTDSPRYEELFGQVWEEIPAFTARRLTLLIDLGFSRNKAERHQRLRDHVRRALGPGPGGVVYLARGPSGHRRDMANETELRARLEAAGVTVIECESDSEALIRRCLDANLILGVEGSQLCHAIYLLAERGAILTIQPPDRFCNAHHDWSRHLGIRYGTVIGKHVEDGWIADPDEVLAMIDALLEPRR
jgi:hypothetical protein